jgi:hypothetical protein
LLAIVTFESHSHIAVIQEAAFWSCSSLVSIWIPKSVCRISDGVFKECARLSTVTFEIPSQLHDIGRFAFDKCTSLNSIDIPASVRRIRDRCFKRCLGLSHVAFASGSSLTEIDPSVFEECLKLELIVIPQSAAVRLDIGFLVGKWHTHVVILPDFAISGFETIPASKQVGDAAGGRFTADDEYLSGYQMLLQNLMIGKGS